MKNILSTLLILAVNAVVVTSCSDIDSDDRLIPVEGVQPARTILFEDYTGQNCVNCPAAHVQLENIVSAYPDNVIPVSIHATSGFGIPVERGGLMQPEGTQMASEWGITTTLPMGVINRAGKAVSPQYWEEAVREQVALPTNVGIDLEATLADGNISITATFTPEADAEATLHIWVLESGIVARQRDKDKGTITDYVHNNVYRCAVGSIEGEAVSLKAHIHSTVTATQPVRTTETETWNTANLSVVAFLQTPSGILQAARAEVK